MIIPSQSTLGAAKSALPRPSCLHEKLCLVTSVALQKGKFQDLAYPPVLANDMNTSQQFLFY